MEEASLALPQCVCVFLCSSVCVLVCLYNFQNDFQNAFEEAKTLRPQQFALSARLRRNVEELHSRNEVPANRIAELCGDINRVSSKEFTDFSRKNVLEPHNVGSNVRRRFLKKTCWMPD